VTKEEKKNTEYRIQNSEDRKNNGHKKAQKAQKKESGGW